MDLTTLISHGISTCFHAGFLLWIWSEHAPIITDQEPEIETIVVEEKELLTQQQKQEATFTELRPVPEFAVSVPDRQALQVAALPIAKLPNLEDSDLFKKALLEPLANNLNAGDENQDMQPQTAIALPQAQFNAGSLLLLPHREHGTDPLGSRSNDIQDFAYVINIIISNHYRKQWRQQFNKRMSNHEFQLLIQTQNSTITSAEIIRGSGIEEFDELLIRYIKRTGISGPPIQDGQYPIVLKLN